MKEEKRRDADGPGLSTGGEDKKPRRNFKEKLWLERLWERKLWLERLWEETTTQRRGFWAKMKDPVVAFAPRGSPRLPGPTKGSWA